MPRPFVVFGFTFFFQLILLSFTSDIVAYCSAIFFIISFMISLCIKKVRGQRVIPVFCLSALIACLSFIAATELQYKPVLELEGKTLELTGTVENSSITDGGTDRVIVKTEMIGGKKQKTRLSLFVKDLPDLRHSDKITATANFYRFENQNKISALTDKSRGIYIQAWADTEACFIEPATTTSIIAGVRDFRTRVVSAITKNLPNEAGALIVAMLFGDKSSLSKDIVKDFRNIGMAHITAVSGLHLSMLSLFLMSIFKLLRIKKRAANLLLIVFVLYFMALAEFTSSVVRAGIMLLVLLTGNLIHREADSINSLGIAVLLITLINPFSAADIGLQLSFFATLGILCFYRKIFMALNGRAVFIKNAFLKKVLSSVFASAAVTASASIFTLPLLVIYFKQLSLISILANVLLVFLASWAMVLGALSGLLSLAKLFSFITFPLSLIAGGLSTLVIKAAAALSDLSFSLLSVNGSSVLIALSFSLLILAFAVMIFKKNGKRTTGITAFVLTVILASAPLGDYLFSKNKTYITVFDNENASAYLVTHAGQNILLGCGSGLKSPQSLIYALENKNIRSLNTLVIPATTPAESSAAYEVCNTFSPRNIVLPKKEHALSFLESCTPFYVSSYKQKLSSGLEIDYMYKDGNGSVLLDYRGVKVLFLFTPALSEGKLPAGWEDAEILVCRGKPPLWLNYNSFKAVISSYNQPIESEYTMRFDRNRIKFYNTADCGDITISLPA
ncbi:MAG: ComEC/Rec2 family competence protein [Acutalibacteraceae bacterium]|jgi:competence protein ComEC